VSVHWPAMAVAAHYRRRQSLVRHNFPVHHTIWSILLPDFYGAFVCPTFTIISKLN
jgi:hypothetical protein